MPHMNRKGPERRTKRYSKTCFGSIGVLFNRTGSIFNMWEPTGKGR